MKITKEWFEKAAAREGDHEIGAGRLPTYIPGFVPSEADRYYNAVIAGLHSRIAELESALSVPAAAVVGEPVARDIDWGGQAFPSEGGSDSGLHPDPGMSLRDVHASSALKGFCANPAIFAGNDYSGWALVNCTEEQLAVVCHRLADAMIAARKKVASP